MASNPSSSLETPVTIKISLSNGENRRFKLPLRELVPVHLTDRLRELLAIPLNQDVLFERFSDSAGTYITLDSNNPSVYKQLYRAAKAKLKLRIKVTVADNVLPTPEKAEMELPCDRLESHCYVQPSSPDHAEDAISNLTVTPSSATVTVCNSPCTAPVQPASPNPRVEYPPTKTQRLRRHAFGANLQHELSMKSYEGCTSSLLTPKASTEAAVETAAAPTKVAANTFTEDEAPVPGLFSARDRFYKELANMGRDRTIPLRCGGFVNLPAIRAPFTICCNNCDDAIPNTHWHCSICDDGDFDLCAKCVEKGVLCDAPGHWLIKRFLDGGKVITSTTETIAPKKDTKAETETSPAKKDSNIESEKEIPGAFTSEIKETVEECIDVGRTCNSCVNTFDEANFVTCTICEDYDLCIPCHVGLKHGHHPSHRFEPASSQTNLDVMATKLCAPGRGLRHLAICDGCDKDIYGVRHKCLNCPDWDYCSICIKSSRQLHPGHRFVPLYEPIQTARLNSQRHYGVHCDGPLCVNKGPFCIIGDRYKCAVCHDTDFCANCEALPTNHHNRTHPLIKFKSSVGTAHITTLNEKQNGELICRMGDQKPQTSSKSTETTPAAKSANAATQVQTIAEFKPTELASPTTKVEAKPETKPEAKPEAKPEVKPEVQPEVKPEVKPEAKPEAKHEVKPEAKPEAKPEVKPEAPKTPVASKLDSHFVKDTIIDGTLLAPGVAFTQVWTVRNPGPKAWPAGCYAHFVCGDFMFNIDSNHPSSSSDLAKATQSKVINHVVEVGDEAEFVVQLKTPVHEGRAISYWRPKAADGESFGHRLWCDVTVRTPKPEVRTGVEEVANIKHEDVKEEASHSQMIFPKLEKESPVASVHEAETAPAVDRAEFLEFDVESITSDDDESDEGFWTDGEFELLNASDDDGMEAINGKK